LYNTRATRVKVAILQTVEHMDEIRDEGKPLATTAPAHADARSGRSAAWGALWPTLGYLVFWQIAPRIRDERMGTVVASTLVSLFLVVLVAASLGRALRSARAGIVAALCAAIVVVPLRWMAGTGVVAKPWLWVAAAPGLADLAFILLGAGAGVVLSGLVRSANMVPPVAAVLALVDVWTVTLGGPVQQIMTSQTEGARRIAEAMTVRLPAITAGAAPIAVVGFADFLFIAFFVAAMCRFAGDREGYVRTVLPLAVVLCLYMLVVLATGWRLPALAPMAVVVLAVHWRRFRYERSEAFALLYAGLFVAALAAAMMLLRRA
jgi:hypothetical protein